jgi:hypothetical protein
MLYRHVAVRASCQWLFLTFASCFILALLRVCLIFILEQALSYDAHNIPLCRPSRDSVVLGPLAGRVVSVAASQQSYRGSAVGRPGPG